MKYIITNELNDMPKGFRNLTDEEIVNNFLKLDADKDYFISKNEWMANLLKLLIEDIGVLEKEGPDAIMFKIKEFSEEFDRYDIDKNKYIDYLEYKNFLTDHIYISE